MATKKRPSPINEIQNFANTYLGKVTKFQGNSLFGFGVLSHLLSWRWKTSPPPPVLIGLSQIFASFSRFHSDLSLIILKSSDHYYMFDISQLWLTSHPGSTVVLLDTGNPGTSKEIYSEHADGEARTHNPSVINRVL